MTEIVDEALDPIFIGGQERCGKSILRAFLTSHPNIIFPEIGTYMWSYFYGRFGDLNKKENFDRCLEAMLDYKHVAKLKPDPDRIGEEFWQGTTSYARLFAIILTHYAESKGKKRWGDQGVMLERYANLFFSAYPGVKMIHLIRDPRDRFAASLERGDVREGKAGGSTSRWLYSVRLADRNQVRFNGDYMVVGYESLVSYPEDTLREVCAFLNEDYFETMLTMDGAQNFKNKLTRGKKQISVNSPVSSEYIGQYQKNLSLEDIAFIQTFSKSKMSRHGYPSQPVHFTFKEGIRYIFIDFLINLVYLFGWRFLEFIRSKYPQATNFFPNRI